MSELNKHDIHNQNIDKVRKLYKDMIFFGMGNRQKNKWIKLFEPELERWFNREILKLLEEEDKDGVGGVV